MQNIFFIVTGITVLSVLVESNIREMRKSGKGNYTLRQYGNDIREGFVYLFYSATDTIILFLPYPAMLISRFVCGGLGISSATIRETAVQSYLPEQMRARVNAFFDVLFAIGGVLFQFLAGALGQVVPYRVAAVFIGMISIISILVFIILPNKVNRQVYEAVRSE